MYGSPLGITQRYQRVNLHRGGFMARGAKTNLVWISHLGVPTLRDGSVGLGDGRERFFPEGFNVGGHL